MADTVDNKPQNENLNSSEPETVSLSVFKKIHPNAVDGWKREIIVRSKEKGMTHEKTAAECTKTIGNKTYRLSKQAVDRIIRTYNNDVQAEKIFSLAQQNLFKQKLKVFAEGSDDERVQIMLSPDDFKKAFTMPINNNSDAVKLYASRLTVSEVYKYFKFFKLSPKMPQGFLGYSYRFCPFDAHNTFSKTKKKNYSEEDIEHFETARNKVKGPDKSYRSIVDSYEEDAQIKYPFYCMVRPLDKQNSTFAVLVKPLPTKTGTGKDKLSNKFFFTAFSVEYDQPSDKSSSKTVKSSNFVGHVIDPLMYGKYNKEKDGFDYSPEVYEKLKETLPDQRMPNQKHVPRGNIVLFFDFATLRSAIPPEVLIHVLNEFRKNGVDHRVNFGIKIEGLVKPPQKQPGKTLPVSEKIEKAPRNTQLSPKNIFLSTEENKKLTNYCNIMNVTKVQAVSSILQDLLFDLSPPNKDPFNESPLDSPFDEEKLERYSVLFFHDIVKITSTEAKISAVTLPPEIAEKNSLIDDAVIRLKEKAKRIRPKITGISEKALYRYIIVSALNKVYDQNFKDFYRELYLFDKNNPSKAWEDIFKKTYGITWESYVKCTRIIDFSRYSKMLQELRKKNP